MHQFIRTHFSDISRKTEATVMLLFIGLTTQFFALKQWIIEDIIYYNYSSSRFYQLLIIEMKKDTGRGTFGSFSYIKYTLTSNITTDLWFSFPVWMCSQEERTFTGRKQMERQKESERTNWIEVEDARDRHSWDADGEKKAQWVHS